MEHECCWHPFPENVLTQFGVTGHYCCGPFCKNIMVDQKGVERTIKPWKDHTEDMVLSEPPKLFVGVKKAPTIFKPPTPAPSIHNCPHGYPWSGSCYSCQRK